MAGSKDVAGIREFLGADSMAYLSVEGLLSPFPEPQNFCTACFTGKYATDISDMGDKLALEDRHLELNLESA